MIKQSVFGLGRAIELANGWLQLGMESVRVELGAQCEDEKTVIEQSHDQPDFVQRYRGFL